MGLEKRRATVELFESGCGHAFAAARLWVLRKTAKKRLCTNGALGKEALLTTPRKMYSRELKVAGNVLDGSFHADGTMEKLATDVAEFSQPWGKACPPPVMGDEFYQGSQLAISTLVV